MNRGYVLLWRKTLDAEWLKDHKLWALWSYLLLKATHRDYEAMVGLQRVHLKPGQLIFGLQKAAKDLNMSVWQIRARLDFLKKAGNIAIKTTNKFSVITIVNWSIYQIEQEENRTQNRKQTANKPQHTRTIEQKNKITVPFTEIVSHLNAKTGKAFRATTKKTKSLIKARFDEGHTYDDFLRVIDHKTTSWINDPKMCAYLRPETLFGTKFEAYLNENGSRPSNSQKPDNSTQDACWQDFPNAR